MTFNALKIVIQVKTRRTPNFVLEKPFYSQIVHQNTSETIYTFSSSRLRWSVSHMRWSLIVSTTACEKFSSFRLLVSLFPSFCYFLQLSSVGQSCLFLDAFASFLLDISLKSLQVLVKKCNDRVSSVILCKTPIWLKISWV